MELDAEKRKEIYYDIQRITFDQALVITLEEWTRRRFTRSWLTNYVHNAGYPTYYFWHFEKGATQG
jgi:ABC-type transport system substrate-binding protein